ncbi:MAG: glycosyhydrolase, partial [Prevotellaceae bacterium]|nr:glycosyhydrolase [Prevotellaceae bacterium]
MKKLSKTILIALLLATIGASQSWCRNHDGIVSFAKNDTMFVLFSDGKTTPILLDANAGKGIARAVNDLRNDFELVTQLKPELLNELPASGNIILAGEAGKSVFIDRLVKSGKINISSLNGKREKYIIQTVSNPFDGISEALVIV